MIICKKCKKLTDCKEGRIFLELKKTINLTLPDCEFYEEKRPEFNIIKGGRR